jgi:acetylornithine deacetylase/succinyl-diaminopimelate desuccinylase-like protein
VASGIVPSSFRIMRALLDRLEDPATGEILLPEFNVPIPEQRVAEARAAAATAPGAMQHLFPLVPGMHAASDDDAELILSNTWRPTLSVIGAAGFPPPAEAGNVLRAETTLSLSFRLPPTADAAAALAALERALTTDVPYGAQVELTGIQAEDGWDVPPPAPWLETALTQSGQQVMGETYGSIGIGGSVPFMGLLGRLYPDAQFVITGALGTDSNMHVPDEWLNIGFAEQVTEVVAHLLDAHARS